MPLRVSGKNLDIGKSLRTHVQEKVQTLIARYFDGKITGHVVITPEGSAYRTDCALHLSSGMNLQSEGRAHEPYASFEQAADKIERRLRKYKKRLKEHASGHDEGAAAVEPREIANFVIAAPAEDEEEGPAEYAPGHRRRGRAAAEDAVRGVGGVRTRSQRGVGRGLPTRHFAAREHRLPPSRRRHRLAGPALSGFSRRAAFPAAKRDRGIERLNVSRENSGA